VERLDHQLEDRSGNLWDWLCPILDSPHQVRNVSRTVGHDDAELSQMPAQGIDDLGSLLHQEITGAEHNRRCLSLVAFGSHETHRRALGRLADRFRIGRIVLLALTASRKRAG
jgi:hypothetical protein